MNRKPLLVNYSIMQTSSNTVARSKKHRRLCGANGLDGSGHAQKPDDAKLEKLDEALSNAVNARTRNEERQFEAEAQHIAQDVSTGLRWFGQFATVAPASAADGKALLRLHGIDTTQLLSPEARAASSARAVLTVLVASAAVLAAYNGIAPDIQLLALAVASGVYITDQGVFGGALDLITTDAVSNLIFQNHRRRVALHEAGHFLVGYGLGVLPKAYSLNALQAAQQGNWGQQGGTIFCDRQIEDEFATGQVNGDTVRLYASLALSGVCGEYVGMQSRAEGGFDDIAVLDNMFEGLGFSQSQASTFVNWAVLNSVLMLRQNKDAHSSVAIGMQQGKSVASLIDLIEQSLKDRNTEV